MKNLTILPLVLMITSVAQAFADANYVCSYKTVGQLSDDGKNYSSTNYTLVTNGSQGVLKPGYTVYIDGEFLNGATSGTAIYELKTHYVFDSVFEANILSCKLSK